jgi:outer membrane lipase/esterase
MKRAARLALLLGLVCLATSSGVHATYSKLFIFGDSLSDSGNNAVFAPETTSVPISGNTFIPTYPYASGHYTNGEVWAQSFAASFGLSAIPSVLGGTDYAFGGATTGPLSPNALPGGLFDPFPPSLRTQVAFFLSQYADMVPSNALYVVAGGGNNARDALAEIFACGDPSCVQEIIAISALTYAQDIGIIVGELELAGAQHIVVWNSPDVGKAPAVEDMGGAEIGSLLASSMNAALLNAIGGDPGVMVFDLFGFMDQVVNHEGKYNLTNVDDACAQFVNCDPSTYLFWDGIHPTSAGHALISSAMLRFVPEPATAALFGAALAILAFCRRRKVQRVAA